jgi:hypothetical protein
MLAGTPRPSQNIHTMHQPELVLLSPYRLPAQNPLVLSNEDMACWMNAHSALWHPAALWGAANPPRIDSAYDHEQPRPGFIYALPLTPPLLLPDDWDERVRRVGAVAFRATADRRATLVNLKEALKGWCDRPGPLSPENPGERPEQADGQAPAPTAESLRAARKQLLDCTPESAAPFFGIGFGYIVIGTLCEAMEHENLLAAADFWEDVQHALAALAGISYETGPPSPVDDSQTPTDSPQPESYDEGGEYRYMDPAVNEDLSGMPEGQAQDGSSDETSPVEAGSEAVESEPVFGPDACRRHLQSAADRLQAAREVLYPVTIHALDILLLEEKRLDAPFPAAVERGYPLNVVASASLLEKLREACPEQLDWLREKVAAEMVEVCGGSYREREDALLPIESQIWNLLKGLSVSRELLGSDIRIYARKRVAAHPQVPILLNAVGLQRALLVPFDETALPSYQVTVINWPAPDGKQIEAFTRTPYPADNPQTFFHLAHYLCQTIRQDHSATLALLHRGSAPASWYEDWLELCRFGPILGQWTTFSRYFTDVLAGEHVSSLSADEFQSDYLSERTAAAFPDPVSWFARHIRWRRRLDTAWSLAALQRGLAGRNDPLRLNQRLLELEDQLESAVGDPGPALLQVEKEAAETLAARLLARATAAAPGYLVLNPCSFTRRLALELDNPTIPLPIAGPVKACQVDAGKLRVVIEVPGLGFAWFPGAGPAGTPPPTMRMRLADERTVRNEFFEAEVDMETGGLRAIRDHKTRLNRLGQKLVFNPGSTMRASSVNMTSQGPALGEIVSEGAILGEGEKVLAKFRQRFRAWLGRPVLDLRIEIYPDEPATGYPWHHYFGARFAWRDERAMLLRGVNGTGYVSTQTRPQTPDFLELRLSKQSVVIFPGGLPFHQRHENRMLDIILQPEGEKAHVFDLALALDRDFPMQTALGLITPVTLVPTTKGPPHVGATGWLFHLDASNLLLTGMRPVAGDRGPADAIQARLLECGAYGGQAELRCPRDPRKAVLLDARGASLLDATCRGDAASFEVMPGDLATLKVEFS